MQTEIEFNECFHDVAQGSSGSSSSTKVGNNVTALLDLSFLVSFVCFSNDMYIMRQFLCS